MSLTDLVIPQWVRTATISVAAILLISAGAVVEHWRMSGALESARAETISEREKSAAAGNRAMAETINETIARTNTTEEVSRESSNRRDRLDQRIAAGGLHNATADRSGGCHLPAIASGPSRTDEGAPQPVPTDAGRDPGEAPVDAAAEVQPTQQVVDDAARDAQQLADLIEWVCRQGMCP